MMNNLENKVIWITGASSGIGEALAYAFNREKAKIIISARRTDELTRVKKNCQNPELVSILQLDLSKHQELEFKAKEALSIFNGIDVLINNGGISQRALAAETKIDIDKRIMDINYFGSIILTKNILPTMLEKKSGSIVSITSLLGKFGTAYRSAYAASKHALHGFFDSLRSEVYQQQIQILLVVPGFIKTNVSINALSADGSPTNTMDPGQENGMLPEKLAYKIIEAIKTNKEEITVGGKETMGVLLKRFVPGLFSGMIRKQKVR
jgi:short-subunit dehydrogenase